jgi:hypothetical protein
VLEYTGQSYECLKCDHSWSHEDDACPECGGDFVDKGGSE